MNGALFLFAAATVGFIVLMPKKAIGYTGGQPFELELGSIGGGLYLSVAAAGAFNAMKAAAARDGIELVPTGPRSAFRTYEQQQSILGERPEYAARNGYSPHQRGIAVDLECLDDRTGQINPACLWLRANAGRFKFVDPLRTKEPWHWEFRP